MQHSTLRHSVGLWHSLLPEKLRAYVYNHAVVPDVYLSPTTVNRTQQNTAIIPQTLGNSDNKKRHVVLANRVCTELPTFITQRTISTRYYLKADARYMTIYTTKPNGPPRILKGGRLQQRSEKNTTPGRPPRPAPLPIPITTICPLPPQYQQ